MPDTTGAGLDQAAIDASLEAYNQARATYDSALAAYNSAEAYQGQIASEPNADAVANTAATARLNTASTQLDNARSQLGTISNAHSALLGRLATAYEANQRAAKDPNEQAMWAANADAARAHSTLYAAEGDMYAAKTQAAIDAAASRAETARQNAQTSAARQQSTGAVDASRVALNNAHLAAVPQLTASTIALHDQTIANGKAGVTKSLAAAALSDARATVLVPAEAKKFLSAAGLDDAKISALNITTPLKLGDLAAKAGLEQAKAAQIYANMSKQQQAPYADTKAPNLLTYDPRTGTYSSQTNPAYTNPQAQPITDTYAAIDQIQAQIASGQMTPQDGDALIANLKQSLDATSKGFTPEQYQARQQTQATFGQGVVDKMHSQGNTMADTLVSAAKGARTPVDMSPYENAINMGGGLTALQQAYALIGQVKPITDHASAIDAIIKYGGAKALLETQKAAAEGKSNSDASGSGAASNPQPQPAVAAPGQAGTSADPTLGATPPAPFAQSGLPEGGSRGFSTDQGAPDDQSRRLLQAAMGTGAAA